MAFGYGLLIVVALVDRIAAFFSPYQEEEQQRFNATAEETWCRQSAGRLRLWIYILAVAPLIINFCTILILVFTVIHVKALKSVTEAITSSTHWLTRTAVRVGLGPSAHQALAAYARGKGYINLIMPLRSPRSSKSTR